MKAPTFPPGATAGDATRLTRESQGMGLRETCRATGMSPTALSDFERNRPGTSVGAGTLAALAQHLGLDPWEMLLRDGRVPGEVVDALRRDPVKGAAALRRLLREIGGAE